MGADLLQLRDFSVYYEKFEAVQSLRMAIGTGEGVGLMGRNGAGKTSVLKGVMGLVKTSGTRLYKGQDLGAHRPYSLRRLGIAYLPQEERVFNGMTVEENLRLGPRRGGEIDRALSLFPELRGHLSQMGATLSGGEQVMLSLARTVSADPELLLLDEPTEGLMPELEGRLTQKLVSLVDGGATVVVAEQNQNFLERVCSRVYHLKEGRLARVREFDEGR
ncbi:MAG: ABC transporter ATP-binding protein [Candidatus Bipolaricaulota bacterium]